MKSTLIILSSCLSTLVSSQTNIIALKSHAGTMAEIALEKDNFGEYIPPKVYHIDSVIFVKPGYVIESKIVTDRYIDSESYRTRDTIYDPTITKNLTYTLRQKYPASVIYVGFDNDKLEPVSPQFKGMKKNGGSTLMVLFELLIFLGFFRRYRLHHVR